MFRRPASVDRWLRAMEPSVFLGSAALVLAFLAAGGLYTEATGRLFGALQSAIADTFGWFTMLAVTFLLGFVGWLCLSRHGSLRLGGDDARPEFGRLSWFTMLFSAGMGMGLVFWGVAEPITHYVSPPLAEARSLPALRDAMVYSFFHWGFHPWAIYIVFALSIAYFHFRHGLPLAPRSMLYPLLGDRVRGPIGHGIDILCTVGTLLGVATSLGLGAMQLNTGLGQLAGMPQGPAWQLLIIGSITLVATLSVVSGLHRGIVTLSRCNMLLAGLLLLFVFVAGPSLFQLELLVSTTGAYLSRLIDLSLWLDLQPEGRWQTDWTLFYWGWWISWSPFVGVFVARISRGRTIREFVAYVSLVPVAVTFLWLAVFGGAGLHAEHLGDGGLARQVTDDVALSLHALLDQLPLASVTQWLSLLLIAVFFVTSSDSGSLVDDMVTSGGHPDPPALQRVFWAVSEGAVAAVLLLVGGLQALQTAAITSGLPMTLLLLAACAGLVRALAVDSASDGVPDTGNLPLPEAPSADPPTQPTGESRS